MATNFPTSLDSLTNPTSSDTLASPDHAGQHSNANDAIEALQAKVGVDGSAVTSSLDYKVAVNTPAGVMQMYGGSSAPTGWLLCDGTAVSRSTYSALFAVIGTTFGAGNGTTTFNVPDMRSRMPIGVGTGTGLSARTLAGTGGVESVTLTGAQSGTSAHGHGNTFTVSDGVADRTGTDDTDHTHTYTVNGRQSATASHGHSGSTTAATAASNAGATNYALGGTSSGRSVLHRHPVYFSGSVSNSTEANATSSHENMPPFVGLNFIIKV